MIAAVFNFRQIHTIWPNRPFVHPFRYSCNFICGEAGALGRHQHFFVVATNELNQRAIVRLAGHDDRRVAISTLESGGFDVEPQA